MSADATTGRAPTERAGGGTPPVVRLLVLATFVVILNETIMVNAIPRLMEDLRVTEQSAQWVSTAFMLTMAAVIPVTGWFLQRVTTRQAYTAAMGVFLTGTLVSALAPVFPVLIAGRVVQAAGTAVMLPLLMTTLMNVVPEEDRGRVMGNVTMAISVAPALGPTVSGVVLQLGSWRLLFLLVLPIAASVTALGLRRLENVGEPVVSRIDWISVVLAAVGFGSLVYGLSGFAEGVSGVAAATAAVGVTLVTAFVLRQRRLQRSGTPLLDLRTLRRSVYTRALLLMAVMFMAMLGSMILLPLYLQNVRSLTPLQTGLLVMPGGLAMGLLGPTVGRLYDRYGARVLVRPGSVGILVALVGLTRVGMDTPFLAVLGLHLLLMVSLAAVFTPSFTLGLGALPQPLYSHGSSLLGTLQQVSAAVGTALSVTVLTLRSGMLLDAGVSEQLAELGGLRWAFGVGAAVGVLGVVLAFTLPRKVHTPPPAPDEAHADVPEQVGEDAEPVGEDAEPVDPDVPGAVGAEPAPRRP
jgi:DHA2 family lincomycin resistance protein-like MFS transporter